MKIRFQKYHGAGNDFIIVNGSDLKFLDAKFISEICARKTGIGADGLIAITPPSKKDKSAGFRFLNSDGKEVDFCGNGLRCAAMFCRSNFKFKKIVFRTNAGICRTKLISDKTVLIEVPINSRPEKLKLFGKTIFSCSAGVPHAVMIVKNLDELDVEKNGRKIRWHKLFSPKGTNANFAEIMSENTISLRTYERGVEGETEACGSGACASALSLAIFANLSFPVNVLTKSRYSLMVFLPNGKDKHNTDKLLLEGPAEFSFSGELLLKLKRRQTRTDTDKHR